MISLLAIFKLGGEQARLTNSLEIQVYSIYNWTLFLKCITSQVYQAMNPPMHFICSLLFLKRSNTRHRLVHVISAYQADCFEPIVYQWFWLCFQKHCNYFYFSFCLFHISKRSIMDWISGCLWRWYWICGYNLTMSLDKDNICFEYAMRH